MSEAHPEVVAAARSLLQWGRTRQTVWHDGSADLLAALGSRYTSFEHQPVDVPPLPSGRPPRGVSEAPPQALPQPAILQPRAVPPPTVVPPPVHVEAPRAATLVATAGAPIPAPDRASPSKPRAFNAMRAALVAAVVVASLAAPRLWRAYEASRVVPVTTNSLTIESTPPGSVVLIDGVEAGKTPLTTTLELGPHKVELRFRKKVKTLEVNVTSGNPVVARVEWTKPTPPSRRAKGKASKPKRPAEGQASASEPPIEPAPTAAPDAPAAVEPTDAPSEPHGQRD